MAEQSLVIVESPAKAKTINKYLGKGYRVEASMGHVRDLPKKKLGVDIEHGFEPTYQTIRGRGKTLKKLRSAAKSADSVYLAPDPDREGEAIAWHVVQALKLPDAKAYRVTFNEITKRAVRAAFEHPGKIDMARVNAQQARRVLDRIVGYQLSPLLWKKVAKGLSAGRVQSVAVRLIVEREKEIRAFEPEEYWEIRATLAPAGEGEGQSFEAELLKWQGEKFRPDNEDDAQTVARALRAATFTVDQVKKKKQKKSPGPPFNTSLLQQAASSRLRFSASRTMRVAQQLYEGIEVGGEGSVGLITYMRTDSFRMAGGAVDECRRLIPDKYGADYLPKKPRFYKSRKGAQEAHEAIRPTSVSRTPEDLKPFLSRDQHRLYKLIWDRFVASQMADARYEATTVAIRAGEGRLRARGRICIFPGHTRVWPRKQKDQQDLPDLAESQRLDLIKLEPSQHFTEPPRRYTEASLVRTLEREGIGRPSTYAPIISTIQKRGYVKQIKRAFHATELGIVVTDLLVDSFPDIMDVQFTSEMEEKLDKIEEEDRDWQAVLGEFYRLFKADLEKAETEMQRVKGKKTGETCP
ncbi:MAG: type I DNA topoisomerase, partial [Planctomycetota bacterium]